MAHLIDGVNEEISNQDYHSDKKYLSSSTFKDILKSPYKFYKKHILKDEFKQLGSDAMDLGSYLHSLILEPDKTEAEFAIYDGVRRGAAYVEFTAQNAGKTYITAKQDSVAQEVLRLVHASSKCQTLLSHGSPEFTYCTELEDVPVKVRADWLNLRGNYIADLKTTSAELNKDSLMGVISKLDYDLSAALYVDAFSKFLKSKVDFYFIFASTRGEGVEVYRASDALLENGRRKYKKAVKIYKECIKSGNWKSDEIEDIDHAFWGTLYETLKLEE